ncbi:MAG TPA: ABC transporter substrate-binding protein, partial [Patescibacteria group bacterium]|nr:ABC transporter substrate-binding protein [Patescibacteria group bacterium]
MQKRFSNFVMLAEIVLLSFAFITGISVGADNQVQPKWGGTLVVVLNDEIGAVNPALVSSTTKGHVTGQIFSTLTVDEMDPITGEWTPTPSLAESWEVSSDSLTITYHLVQNATWHDGVPFTSADVKFSFMDVIMKNHPAAKVTWRKVTQVDAPDDYTVVFHLSEPDPDFLINHSTAYGAIIPKHKYTHLNGTVWSGAEIKSVAGDPAFAIGTGPFMMQEWVKGDHITLVRNPNYFRAPLPYLDKIVFKVIPDPSMRVLSMEAGEVDFYPFEVTSTDVVKLNSSTIAVTDQG